MRITRIETFKFWVDWCNWLFVRVDTDEGVSGWGEGSLHGALESVETAIREMAFPPLWMRAFGRSGAPVSPPR
ncbi:MAG: hypothetical protein IT493_16130 [Gammaproteobacteria bacterium]|nr:hypothetical protein [Gammaproteobacteria bacterium]